MFFYFFSSVPIVFIECVRACGVLLMVKSELWLWRKRILGQPDDRNLYAKAKGFYASKPHRKWMKDTDLVFQNYGTRWKLKFSLQIVFEESARHNNWTWPSVCERLHRPIFLAITPRPNGGSCWSIRCGEKIARTTSLVLASRRRPVSAGVTRKRVQPASLICSWLYPGCIPSSSVLDQSWLRFVQQHTFDSA